MPSLGAKTAHDKNAFLRLLETKELKINAISILLSNANWSKYAYSQPFSRTSRGTCHKCK